MQTLKAMLQIDERIDEARIRQFAANAEHIPLKVRNMLSEVILKEQGPEFYHGQLAALQFSHQLEEGTQAQMVTAAAMAVIAEHIVQKGWW